MSETVGYVVVEFNQASGLPELGAFPILLDALDDAEERRDLLQRENREHGRRERYAVGTVTIEDVES